MDTPETAREAHLMLVDTSVWVDHLRRGNARLARQLERADVWCHPFIVAELASASIGTYQRDESPKEILFRALTSSAGSLAAAAPVPFQRDWSAPSDGPENFTTVQTRPTIATAATTINKLPKA